MVEGDWRRETPRKFWDPGRNLMRALRRYQDLADRPDLFSRIRRRYWSLNHEFWRVVTRCHIELTTPIGPGLLLPHPNGIVIHPHARIGRNCTIFQNVTIGVGRPDPGGRKVPVIGDRVDISAGACIVGGVTIGNGARIGLNTVVLNDVPANSFAVGVPARIIPSQGFAQAADRG